MLHAHHLRVQDLELVAILDGESSTSRYLLQQLALGRLGEI